MKKSNAFLVIILCSIISFIAVSFVVAQEKKGAHNNNDSLVFICYSQSVEYYHKSASCSSLAKCNILEKVTEADAEKKFHRKPCSSCSKPSAPRHITKS